MLSFITQFRKAKLNRFRLIYDGVNHRYMIVRHKRYENWYKCELIVNFEK